MQTLGDLGGLLRHAGVIVGLVLMGLSTNAHATCSVTNVQASQEPGTRLVDIYYDVTTDSPPLTVSVAFSTDGGSTFSALPSSSLVGPVGTGVSSGTGNHLVWAAGTYWGGNFSSATRFKVSAVDSTSAPSGFASIPAGSFQMGDALGDSGTSNELPVHTVNVSAFCMESCLATKSEWDGVYTWATANGYSFDHPGAGKAASHPVQTVSWYDVVKWCNARSEKGGLTPCYYTDASQNTVYRSGTLNLTSDSVNWTANGYRLPTEAEWEKAARGGLSGKRFPSGDTISWSLANYYGNPSYYTYDLASASGLDPLFNDGTVPNMFTSPIGSFAANGYGLTDMAGNVTEWCWDWYGTYGSGTVSDPTGSVPGLNRIQRGGGWNIDANYCRVSHRGLGRPYNSTTNSGFRTVCRLSDNAFGETPVITVDARNTNADLSALTLSSGTLSPGFTASGTSYTASVPNNVTSLSVTPTLSDPAATVTSITGTSALAFGLNTVVVTVTAQNTVTTKTYTIFVTRLLSANADLAALGVSAGVLTPGFVSSGTSYTVFVPNSVTGISVTPTLSNSTATVQVTGANGLAVGQNTVTVQVTAQDGVTTKTYSIVVTRDSPGTIPTVGAVAFSATSSTIVTAAVSVNPGQLSTDVRFDYGLTSAYGQSSGTTTLPASGSASNVTMTLSALSPHTTYHVRAFAQNTRGPGVSTDFSFRTLPRLDLNRDGYADVIAAYNAATKPTKMLYVSRTGAELGAAVTGPSIPAGYTFCGVGEFYGDGKTEWVLYQAAARKVWICLPNGARFAWMAPGPVIPAIYDVAGVADMNGDGKPDLVLVTKASPRTAIWLMNGAASIGTPLLGPILPAGFAIVAVDDFNRDGKPDYLLWNSVSRQSKILVLSSSLTATLTTLWGPVIPSGWQLAGADGYFPTTDSPVWLLYNPVTGATQFRGVVGTSLGWLLYGPTMPAGYSLLPTK